MESESAISIQQLQPFLIAGLIGLLIGTEREKAHPSDRAMGVRTFVLLALLGALSGSFNQVWLAATLAIFTLSLIVVSYFSSSRDDSSPESRGLTTEFAGGVVFCLGYSAHSTPVIAIVLAPMVALILFSKSQLHGFSSRLKPSELQAAILLLLLAVVVTKVLEDKVLDSWGIFNPRKFGLLILALAGLQFGSYVLTKFFGETKGALLSGFLGGLISSTAVTLSSAREASKHSKNWNGLLASALAAKIASFFELLFIVAFISWPLLKVIAIPVAIGIATGSGILVLLVLRSRENKLGLNFESPLEIWGVLKLALLLGSVLAGMTAIQNWLGTEGTLVASFLGALFELHGVSVATTTIFERGQLPLNTAFLSIIIAVIASLFAKIAISWVITRNRFSLFSTFVYITMAVAIGFSAWLQNPKTFPADEPTPAAAADTPTAPIN